jgi:hypothetical protein
MSKRHRSKFRQSRDHQARMVAADVFARAAQSRVSLLEEHWPYGPKTECYDFMGAYTWDLRTLDPERWTSLKGKTDDQLRFMIVNAIAGAMHYCTVLQACQWSNWQREEAYRMYQIINGTHGYQAFDQIPRPLDETAMADAVTYLADREKRHPGYRDSLSDPKVCACHFMSGWAEHGRYIEIHRPITDLNTAELRAVLWLVRDCFENMC